MTRRSVVAWLARLLGPAVFVLASAAVFSSWPLRTTLAAARQQEREVAAALPRPEQIAEAEQQLATLRATLQQRLGNPLPSPTAGLPAVAAPGRAAWHRQLTDVLQRHRLVVLAEDRVDVDLPAGVALGLFGNAAHSRCAAWSLQLTGSYLDVLAAVTALREGPLPTFVLELSMRRLADGALTWTLVVT